MQWSTLNFLPVLFLPNLPLTHEYSFVAPFVYVQIGSDDGVVSGGGGYIIGGEVPPDPITLTDTSKASSFSCGENHLNQCGQCDYIGRCEEAHEDQS